MSRSFALTFLWILLVAAGPASGPGAAQDDAPPTDTPGVVQRTGAGMFTAKATNEEGPLLRMNWTHSDALVLSATAAADGQRFWCDDGRFAWWGPANVTDGHANVSNATGTWRTGVCTATADGDTLHLHLQSQNHSYEGRFTARDDPMYLADGAWHATPQGPSLWPGLVITGLATLFLLGMLAAVWLLVRERRLSRYLVRRLYEETKGRVPKDWPPGPHHQWIARAFFRSKN